MEGDTSVQGLLGELKDTAGVAKAYKGHQGVQGLQGTDAKGELGSQRIPVLQDTRVPTIHMGENTTTKQNLQLCKNTTTTQGCTIKQKDNDRTKTRPFTNAPTTKQSATDKQNQRTKNKNHALALWRIAHVLGSRR